MFNDFFQFFLAEIGHPVLFLEGIFLDIASSKTLKTPQFCLIVAALSLCEGNIYFLLALFNELVA